MVCRVAINGFGRIGRNVLRALIESGRDDIEVVALNDLGSAETNAYLLQYDSVHGRLHQPVSLSGDTLSVAGHDIKISSQRDPADCPWGALDVDLVLECTGFFASPEKSKAHLSAGAKKVLISAPAGGDCPTVVYGVNDETIKANDLIVSNASCTTNCLAPLVKPLNDHIGIESGLMVTVHAYTNDQRLTDSMHNDIRRARSATQSMIPTKTGAAAAVGLVLPELNGKLDGYAMRVPTINVSVVDLTFLASRDTTVEEVNAIMQRAASNELNGILSYVDEPLVSIDFNHSTYSSNFDASQTRQIDRMIKVVSWYDNEWGFSNRMLDTAMAMMKA